MPKQLKFSKNDRKQVNFYFSKKQYEKFVERFPNMTSWFLSHCLQRAINESDFVSKVLTNCEV